MNHNPTKYAQVERRYESFQETRLRLGIGKSSLRRLINEGSIVAIKLGTRTLIDISSVTAFMETLPRISKRTQAKGGEA